MLTSAAAEGSRVSADEVREFILQGLFAGRLVPGQRLVEADLMRMTGSTRSYAREALQRLEIEGLVEITPFRGACIRAFSPQEGHDIEQIFAALMMLAARQAAQHIEEGDNRARLARALDEVRNLGQLDAGHTFAYASARERFHRQIIAISGNREIERICPFMQCHVIRQQARDGGQVYGEARHRERLAYFEAVFAAISAGDEDAAARALRDLVDDLSAPHR